MKLALEALGLYARTLAPTETQKKGVEAITALQEALAEQPAQQEPGRNHWEDGDVFERIAAIKEQPAQPHQEPVEFVSLLREAEEIVQGKPTWNRFIAATPLANDIAVWMTVFAQDVARRYAPQPAQRKPLTDEEIETVWRSVQANDFHDCVKPFARAIEAAHGIKGDA